MPPTEDEDVTDATDIAVDVMRVVRPEASDDARLRRPAAELAASRVGLTSAAISARSRSWSGPDGRAAHDGHGGGGGG